MNNEVTTAEKPITKPITFADFGKLPLVYQVNAAIPHRYKSTGRVFWNEVYEFGQVLTHTARWYFFGPVDAAFDHARSRDTLNEIYAELGLSRHFYQVGKPPLSLDEFSTMRLTRRGNSIDQMRGIASEVHECARFGFQKITTWNRDGIEEIRYIMPCTDGRSFETPWVEHLYREIFKGYDLSDLDLNTAENAQPDPDADQPWTELVPQFAIVELMGHVRLGGRISEAEFGGAKMVRLDIPQPSGTYSTQYIGGAAIYRVTFCDELTAAAAAHGESARPPVREWELTAELESRGIQVVQPQSALETTPFDEEVGEDS